MSQLARTRGALPKPSLHHEDRQALIRQPFACELPGGCCEAKNPRNNIGCGRTWGGPNKRPGPSFDLQDESYLRYGANDDPRQGEL